MIRVIRLTGLIEEDAMSIMTDILQAISIGLVVATFLLNTGRGLQAIEVLQECLILLNYGGQNTGRELYDRVLLEIYHVCGKKDEEGNLTLAMAEICKQQYRYVEARELYERAIKIMKEMGDRKNEAFANEQLGLTSYYLSNYNTAKEYLKKGLAIRIQIGDKAEEAADYGNLGKVFQSLGEYDKAKKYIEKSLSIITKIGDKKIEAANYGNLGALFKSLGEYDKAKEYLEKALPIRIQTGDKKGEAADYGNLGTVFEFLGEYDKAKEYLEKALPISIQMGDKQGEAAVYVNLGTVFTSLGEYDKAKEYLEKALPISIQMGDKQGEAAVYGNLGTVFTFLGEYDKAKEYLEKALPIRIQIGDKQGEAADYENLRAVFDFLGEYDKTKECLKKALDIRIQIGDKKGEAAGYRSLGTVSQSHGEYDKAKEYFEKALGISIQNGDKKGEAKDYGNLGNVFNSLGEYDKAIEYIEKSLPIRIQIGDKKGEAADYGNLGTVFLSRCEYVKAKGYLEKALPIRIQTGDKKGEGTDYGNLGDVFHSLGEYENANKYLEKALAIRIQIGDKQGEAADYRNLGALNQSLGKYTEAEYYIEKALSISRDIANLDDETKCLCSLSVLKLSQSKFQETFHCLFQCMDRSETLRSFLGDNDDFKVSSSDVCDFHYRSLIAFFCFWGNPKHAVYVSELVRARALADLMATQYSLQSQISADPRSWIGIENIVKKESNSSCLYISYYDRNLFFWILKTSGIIHFRRIEVDEKLVGAGLVGAGLVGKLDDFFAKSFRSFGILSEEECEDRSLTDVQNLAALRLIEQEDEESQDSESSETLYYRWLIIPVADLLEEPELIVVPDRSLNQVPFPALKDEGGRYLSDKYRIRIVPSLTTLKLIQDSPACYHSQTGALIVGDPAVGTVHYKGTKWYVSRLPCAGNEATMIGRLLDVQPLLGQHATKQAVLDSLDSVSLIHFAAHGNAERGEIALSPVGPRNKIPEEEDYLLTMSDIAQVQLRAKLVVLSCCHSARGQIRAEGVVGIARAFLGSGARSVLVALWAISDEATKQLMCRFYKHLVRGESASESLHQAMKWMRGNGSNNVRDWAPFMLIGDNVTIDFGK